MAEAIPVGPMGEQSRADRRSSEIQGQPTLSRRRHSGGAAGDGGLGTMRFYRATVFHCAGGHHESLVGSASDPRGAEPVAGHGIQSLFGFSPGTAGHSWRKKSLDACANGQAACRIPGSFRRVNESISFPHFGIANGSESNLKSDCLRGHGRRRQNDYRRRAWGAPGALAGKRTLVLTIDPARRLAQALGLKGPDLNKTYRSKIRVCMAICSPRCSIRNRYSIGS